MSNTYIRIQQCRKASRALATLSQEQRNRGLKAIQEALQTQISHIVEANKKDLAQGAKNHVAPPLMKRLTLSEAGVAQLCNGITNLMNIADPLGKTLSARELDKGLELYQVTVPLGVVAMIFEARPEALVQIATLALKSGNGIVLKGGSEAMESNRVLAELIHTATVAAGIPEGWLVLVESREDVAELLTQHGAIDLIIPRGSNQFVQYIMQNTTIPVLGHADGICHTYIDKYADATMAIDICVDAKTNYPAACNATETILVHAEAAHMLKPLILTLQEASVEVRCCQNICNLLPNRSVILATEEDWRLEYIDRIVSIKLVDSLAAAIEHINQYGSMHTDAIVTADKERAEQFMAQVDSANLYHNCSTRFADGFRYGLGAEVGVSTSKIHARGPVGLDGLVTYTWRLYGSGQKVGDYGAGKRAFTHRELV